MLQHRASRFRLTLDQHPRPEVECRGLGATPDAIFLIVGIVQFSDGQPKLGATKARLFSAILKGPKMVGL